MASIDKLIYWITVKNLTGVPLRFEARYAIQNSGGPVDMRITFEFDESNRNLVFKTEDVDSGTRQTTEERPGESMDAGPTDASLMEHISASEDFTTPTRGGQKSGVDGGAAPTDPIGLEGENGDVSSAFSLPLPLVPPCTR